MKEMKKEEKQKLDSILTWIVTGILFYAVFVLFIYNMLNSSATVLGAKTFLSIMFYISLAGIVLFTALGGYKGKKSLFLYSGLFVLLALSFFITNSATEASKYFNFGAMAEIFVLSQVYSYFKTRGKFEGKVKTIFIVAAVILFLALLGGSAYAIVHIAPNFFK